MLKSTPSMFHAWRRLAVASFLCLPHLAFAQTPELDEARATFARALAEEDAGQDESALEKFRKVAAVRDTASVEYRIGKCEEALGHERAAIAAYDRAARLGRADVQAADVVSAANDRISALAAQMGKLAIVVRGSDAAEVRVDGEAVARADLDAIVLEPGDHVVDVTALGTKPARANVTIARGGKLQLRIDLAQIERPPSLAAPRAPSHVRRDFGIAAIVTGAAFGIAAGAVLFARNDLIDSIHATCPNDVCPIASHDDVESKRALASALEAPAGILAGFALAALAGGIVLVALGPERRATAMIGPGSIFVRGVF